jgi:phosphomannomutase
VFALSCVAELCWLQASRAVDFGSHGNDDQRVAVVVNGPTSNRIDSICDLFGVEVHRAEVGEANVVNRAAELRRHGYLVRLLGEGSNGGNITHPSTIRDPLQTVLALLKLLFSPGSGGRPAPLEIWWERRGVAAAERTATVAGVISSLPRYTTTSAFEDRAIMRIGSPSHAALKREFEALIPEAVAGAGAWLAKELGRRYRLVNYEGTREFPGPGGRTGAETGGLKVIFSNDDGHDTGYAWMRGSGTEPVFRVMADVEGDRPETEERLLDWQKNLVAQADRRAQQ